MVGSATRIKRDRAGRLFVVVNGGVYRAERGPHEVPVPQRAWGKGIVTRFSEGAHVRVSHVRGQGQCRVRSADGGASATEELWAVHGYTPLKPEDSWHQG
jgi:hypothetical protein